MNVLYVVSSNIDYFEKTFPVFTAGIPKGKRDSFVFVVNGSDKESSDLIEGVRVRFVTDNSFSYSPLIDIVRNPSLYDGDFIFLLEDTCYLGKNFFKKVEFPNPLLDSIAVDSLDSDLGWLRKDFILSKKSFIMSMKNCSKEKLIQNRGKLFKIGLYKSAFSTNKKYLPKKNLYGGKARIPVLYDGVDLTKYVISIKESDK